MKTPNALWNVWEQTAAASARKILVFDGASGEPLTAAELTAAAVGIADAAPAAVRAGAIVALAERNSPRWLAAFLALQRLGAAVLPLDASLAADRQAAAAAGLGAHWLLRGPGDWLPLAVAPGAPDLGAGACLIKTTSGSTGRPLSLACTAENMLADGRQIAATMQIGPEDINLGAIPFGHSYGLGNLVMPLLVQGTAVICSNEMLPDALGAQTERFGATVLPSVPAVLRALAESGLPAGRLRTLRRVISAGAPLPVASAARFAERFGQPVRNFYGSSETGGICFDRTGEATLSGRSVGRPLEGVSVRLDADSRVAVSSAAVVAPGEQALADLGAWNEFGELSLTGRATALANIGGKKVAPSEVEAVLRALPGVTDAWVAVRARADIGGGDYLLAAVETKRPQEEIQQELAARLPAWQVPRRLWASTRLPRNARGKLDREELERRLAG